MTSNGVTKNARLTPLTILATTGIIMLFSSKTCYAIIRFTHSFTVLHGDVYTQIDHFVVSYERVQCILMRDSLR